MPINSSLSFTSPSTGGLTDKAVQLITSIQSKFERRNAVRYKITIVFEHRFESILLKEPTFCSLCRNLIWGLVGHGCKECKLISHKRCLDFIHSVCVKSAKNNENLPVKHQFKPVYFLTPTFCNHCGIMIKGIASRQGLECDSDKGGCGMSVHYDCKQLVCFDCGKRDRKVPKSSDTCETDPTEQQIIEENWSTKVSINDFELLKVLGIGSFSKVYLARLKSNGHEFAIKVMKKTNLVVSSDPESTLTEMRLLNFGRLCPFLAVAHCCFQSEDRLYFVMEHLVGRDLLYHIRKVRKFTEDQAKFYSAEIVLALTFLHRKGVVYRDLKLDNVIMNIQGHCKLLDFGMSKELYNTVDMKTRTFCGTPSYISPEIIKEQDYSFSVDWWALGVLMFEMLVGCSPFESEDDDELYRMITQDEVKVPSFLSEEAKSLLNGLLTKDPQTRIGCEISKGFEQAENAILEHPFFKFKTASGLTHLWDKIEAREIEPPYLPTLRELEHGVDGIEDEASLTPIDPSQLKKISQADFCGFSYYSQSFNSMLDSTPDLIRL